MLFCRLITCCRGRINIYTRVCGFAALEFTKKAALITLCWVLWQRFGAAGGLAVKAHLFLWVKPQVSRKKSIGYKLNNNHQGSQKATEDN